MRRVPRRRLLPGLCPGRRGFPGLLASPRGSWLLPAAREEHSILLPLLLAAFLALCCAAGPARAGRTAPQIMRVSEVRAGMSGYGLTTFKGSEVERFEVEVLGVLEGWAPRGSVVLIRMTSPVLAETGTIAGMSGSPVYIDGKLLGAVAYGFYFCKVPIAGVTPVEEMIVARDIDLAAASAARGSRRASYRKTVRERSAAVLEGLRGGRLSSREALAEALGRMVVPLAPRGPRTWRAEELPGRVRDLLPAAGGATMAPLPIPLGVGGAGADRYGAMARLAALGGFVPVRAVSAGGEEAPPPRIEPGMPVGAIWISGDLDISSLGTLTMIDGDRVLAFGHSMLGTGESDFPLAAGSVEAVVPSAEHSFRLSAPGRVIGRLTQDRDSAIVGRLGEEAPMFPCTVRLAGVVDETFRYKIAAYWAMAPFLTFYATGLSAERWEGIENLFTVKATSRIRLEGRPEPIVLSNTYAAFTPMAPALELVWLPLEALMLNPFQEVLVADVEVDLEVQQGFRTARIEGLRVGRREVRPGEALELWVTLREFQGQEHVKRIELPVPEDARPGTDVSILVCDALTSLMAQMSADPGFFSPRDFEGLIASIQRLPSSTDLHVHASVVKQGVRYKGVAMPRLPASVTSMLTFGTETGLALPLLEDVSMSAPTPWVVEGLAEASVRILHPDEQESLSYRERESRTR